MKIRAVHNYIIAVPRSEAAVTAGGIIKPEQSIGRMPGAKVIVIHEDDSKRMGVSLGDIVIYHSGSGGAADEVYNGTTYTMIHVDNVVGVIEEDDSVLHPPSKSIQLQ